MSALFRRGIQDTVSGRLASLQYIAGACRAMLPRHRDLAAVEEIARELFGRMSGQPARGPTPDLDGALQTVRGLAPSASDGDRRDLAQIERMLADIIEEQTALDAAERVEIPR